MFVSSSNCNVSLSACIDHTMLYKSCIKTLRARSKASGVDLPPTRIFPKSVVATNDESNKHKISNNSSQILKFFQRAREIYDNIARHKQLLHDHRKRYLGQINDPSSMSPEECVYMEKVISNNLKTVDLQITELESKVPPSLLQCVKKARTGLLIQGASSHDDALFDPANIAGASNAENIPGNMKKFTDVERCMAVTAVIVMGRLADLNAVFANMKQAKNQKQSVKAKLMRLHRPACVEKDNMQRLRQQQQICPVTNSDGGSEESAPRNSRKKVLFEDWRADEEGFKAAGTVKTSIKQHSSSVEDKYSSSSPAASISSHQDCNSSSSQEPDGNSVSARTALTSGSVTTDFSASKLSSIASSSTDNTAGSSADSAASRSSYEDGSSSGVSAATLSDEETQMLEQENMQLYNELQSTHEEVKQITRQVVELSRLQDVLLCSVEEQALVAESIEHLVVAATDNVQEGNEQIREAMRKDASFRVWIMFFLIVMSFTILFLDWYND